MIHTVFPMILPFSEPQLMASVSAVWYNSSMNIETAIRIMEEGHHTCVILQEDAVLLCSDLRGILPLVEFIRLYPFSRGCIAADRVVGKAAALLCVKAGFSHIHGMIMSEEASAVLDRHHISHTFGKKVQGILNRSGDGPCPMETLSRNVEDPGLMSEIALNWLSGNNLP